MVKYEIKKVFSRMGGKVSLLVLLILTAVTCWFSTRVSFTNENGDKERGYGAVRKLREAQKEWEGVLDEEKIRQVITENVRIRSTPEALSENVKERNIAYGWGQGIAGIRDLLNNSYAEGFRDYNYYRADSLSEEDAPYFYQNRVKLFKEWLYSDEANDRYSEREKEYLIRQYEELTTPFYYDYVKGWTQLFEYMPTITMIGMLVLGYLVAGIFSGEYAWRADSVFFSSMYGRNKAVAAKIKAGFVIVTAVYWTLIFIYSAVTLLYLGADGANCPVQADFSGWKCFYNITNWQKYLLAVAGGYVGCLFICFFCMAISAKMKSAVLAVMFPFILLFIPSFLGNITNSVVSKILGLLPDRLLGLTDALNIFDLYPIGGKVSGAVPLLFALYGLLAMLTVPVIYREYRRAR